MVFRKYDPGTKIATVRMVSQSYSRPSICKALGLSISNQSFNRWTKLYQTTQRVIRDPSEYEKKGPGQLLSNDDRIFIKELLRCEPGLFLEELRGRLYDESNTLSSITTLQRNLVENMEITLKKANTVNIRKSLVAKYKFVDEMESVPAEWLVFTDESSICSKDLLRAYSQSPKGKSADRTLVDQNVKRFTLLPAISFNGVLALTVTDENVKSRNFAHFLKYSLLPRMNHYPDTNSILVLDNACIHGGDRITELCQIAGVKLIYLLTYSPELNTIELCFSQVKSNLRRTQALVGSLDPKWVIERTMYQVISARLCQKLFKHAGYHWTMQTSKTIIFPSKILIPGTIHIGLFPAVT